MYRAARNARDLEVLASGNPKKIVRRAKNKLMGRLLGRQKDLEMSKPFLLSGLSDRFVFSMAHET
jgi:hypothetical protein